MPQKHRDTEKISNHELNQLTKRVISCAILESLYEKALCYELQNNSIKFVRQVTIPVIYKGHQLGDHRLDLLIHNQIILELKAVNQHDPVYEAQLLSYLKLTGKKPGLLINFNVPVLKDGIKRMIL